MQLGVLRIVGGGRITSKVVLTVEPWVPAETVVATYRNIQKRILRTQNRPLSLRNLAVFRFVNKNTNSDKDGMPKKPS